MSPGMPQGRFGVMERRPGSPTSTGAPPTADPAEEQWETTAPPESGPSPAPQRREGGREAGLRLPLLLRPGPGAGPMAGAAEGRVRLEWPAPGVARLVLDRPAALNALSKPMFAELAAHFRALRAREDVAAAILTGAGDRAFSAGVDLKAAAAVFRSAEGDASAELDVVAEMELCPFPIVGAVNGLAITAGFELALACDVLLCSATAFFQDTHCRYGIMPSWGLSQKLPRLLGPQRARFLSLGCVRINAREALEWGLVSQVCADRAALDRAALEVATRIQANHQGVVRGYKKVMNDGLALPLGEARELERTRAFEYYKGLTDGDFAAIAKKFSGRAKKKGAKPSAKL